MHVDKIADKSDYNASVKFNYLHKYVLWLYLHAFIQNRAMGNANTVYNRALAALFKLMSLQISVSATAWSNTVLTSIFNRSSLVGIVKPKTCTFSAAHPNVVSYIVTVSLGWEFLGARWRNTGFSESRSHTRLKAFAAVVLYKSFWFLPGVVVS